MKRLFILILIVLCFGLIACGETNNVTPAEKKLMITGENTVYVGKQLVLDPVSEGIDNPDFTWSINDSSLATIDCGVIKALKEGKLIVTLKENNSGLEFEFEVNIIKEAKNTTKLSINGENVCKVGESIQLTAVYDKDSTVDLVWSSSNNSVATVNNGLVEGVSKGTVTITVTDMKSNLTKEVEITIKSDVITVDDMLDWAFAESGTESLDDLNLPKVNPDTGATFEWSTDREDLLLLNDGYVEFVETDQVCPLPCVPWEQCS